jgi:cyclic-di-GMP-binding protein
MAKNSSFDVSTGVDLQEVDNAVNQAAREVQQRYDFKGVHAEILFDREKGEIRLESEDEHRLKALYEVLVSKCARRSVPLKNLDPSEVELGSLGRARQLVGLKQAIPQDIAKEMVKKVKALKLKKCQIQIQGDELRVSSPSRDTLQEVMAFLKSQDFGIELNFGNFRS